jgi:hypothetical protein
MIGCGLGGLEWKDVKNIFLELIEEFQFNKDDVIVYNI